MSVTPGRSEDLRKDEGTETSYLPNDIFQELLKVAKNIQNALDDIANGGRATVRGELYHYSKTIT